MKRRHHFRPALHLRHFADENGLLWTNDRTGVAAPFQQLPENVGYERLLYSPQADGLEPSDELENWFELNIDRPAAAVLERAARGEVLDSHGGSIMSRFIAAQDMRTPRARDEITALFQMGMDEQFAQWRADPGSLQVAIRRDSGVELTEEELSAHLADTSVLVNNTAWFQFIIDNIDRAAKRLFGMGWSLLHAPPDVEFITNDIGIVKCAGRVDRPVRFMLGFAAGRSHWVFPLTPKTAFAILPTPGGVRAEPASSWVTSINRQVAEDTHRFIYSRAAIPNPWG